MQQLKFFFQNIRLTHLLIVINVLTYVVTFGISVVFFQGNQNLALRLLGGEFTPDILNGEVWRLVTAAFLHAGIIHLAFNMWALYSVGMIVEVYYGRRKLFLTYILTAVGGAVLSFALDIIGFWSSQGTQEGFAVSVGASGAIFGLIGLLLGQRYHKNTYSPDLRIDTYQLWLIVVYNFMLGFGFNLTGGSLNINNWAHLGGLITGFILGVFLDHKNTFYKSGLKALLENSLVAFSFLIFFASVIASLIYIYLTFVPVLL